jgi:hypothetical protein
MPIFCPDCKKTFESYYELKIEQEKFKNAE